MLFQKLQAWQDNHEVGDDELATRISRVLHRKVNRSTIWRAKRGLRMLGMEHQLALQKVTGIPPSEWADFFAQTVDLRRNAASGVQKKSLVVEAGEAA